LYDLDGDGYISFDELFFYLRSVFRILKMCETEKYGHYDVDDLAKETAEDMIREADVSGDGLISLPEFLAWTEQGGQVTPSVETPALKRAGVRDLQDARNVLGLANVSVEELFEALAHRANEQGELSKANFKAVLMGYARRAGNVTKADALCDVLFETLDLNSNGMLDYSEVASGMSVMVGGDKLAKLKVASQLFDLNGDGLITRDEMLTYLTSVFSVVLATHPEAKARVGNFDAERLAQATCDEAFAAADLNHDNVLDFNEFAAWVLGDDKGAATARIADAAPDGLTLQDIRGITGLDRLSPDAVFEALAGESDDNAELDRRAFSAAFQKFARRNLSVQDAGKLRVVVNRMFDLFDADKNGSVSFPELAAGLAVLCSGTKEEKTRAAFQAFGDSDALNRQEITALLRSVFRILLDTIPNAKRQVGVSADELAEATASQCFLEKDPRNSGFVTVQDFHDFFEHDLMYM
jgi:Ca2+-binding EF-hand superfamily protein